jgi:hypothetical protein
MMYGICRGIGPLPSCLSTCDMDAPIVLNRRDPMLKRKRWQPVILML